MAKVTLPLRGSSRLPRCCFVCGDRDASFKRVTIKPQGSDENMLAFAVHRGYRILTLTLPLCDQHRGHFNLQTWLRYGAIVGVMGIAMLGVIPAMTLRMPVLMILPLVGVIGGVIGWYMLSAKLNRNRAHVTALSDDEVTFTNVSSKFVEAFRTGTVPSEPRPARSREADADFVPVESVEETRPRDSGPRRSARTRRDEDDDRDDFDERDDRDAGSPFRVTAFMLVGAFGILILIIVIALGAVMMLGNRPQKGPIVVHNNKGNQGKNVKPKPADPPAVPEEIAKLTPQPLPIDPAWDEKAMQRTYLSDMQEFDTATGWGKFGKNGMLGYPKWGVGGGNDPIMVKGAPVPKGISFTAGGGSHGRAKYRLNEPAKLLIGGVAMSDMPPESNLDRATTPFWFTIWGDGKLLWKSRPIQMAGESEAFRPSIEGVKELEIRASNPLSGHHIRATWMDPAVYR